MGHEEDFGQLCGYNPTSVRYDVTTFVLSLFEEI